MPVFEYVDVESTNAVIRVIGVGGGGGNAVDHMLSDNLEGVEFVVANTDAQALNKCQAQTTMQLGGNVTRGLGAGANPEVGRQAALEDRERINEILQGADMVFLAAGMGGGTGTGALPVIAQAAREMGILSVAVVTKPFGFEGPRRMKIAEQGIEELTQHVDSLITIPNNKLGSVLGGEITLLNAFAAANDVLKGAVQGIAELITRPGLINVDFADVKTVMSEMGMAMMGSGTSKGDDRALEAAEAAIGSPLLEDVDLTGACGILVNVTAGLNLSMQEYQEIGETIHEFASEDATIVMGTSLDESMQDELRVTVVATGLGTAAAQGQQGHQRPVRLVGAPVEKIQPVQQKVATAARHQPGVSMKKTEQSPVAADPQRDLMSAESAAGTNDFLDIPAFLRQQAD
ncbi:MAG: cell division protein FtsZ [bacterium]